MLPSPFSCSQFFRAYRIFRIALLAATVMEASLTAYAGLYGSPYALQQILAASTTRLRAEFEHDSTAVFLAPLRVVGA